MRSGGKAAKPADGAQLFAVLTDHRTKQPLLFVEPAALRIQCVGLTLFGTHRGRSQLSGVTRDGKSRACFAHNIEKSLAMLREDARVPIEHLWANDAIQEVHMLHTFVLSATAESDCIS